MSRYRDPQLQVFKNYSYLLNSFKMALSVHTCFCGRDIFLNVYFLWRHITRVISGSVLYRRSTLTEISRASSGMRPKHFKILFNLGSVFFSATWNCALLPHWKYLLHLRPRFPNLDSTGKCLLVINSDISHSFGAGNCVSNSSSKSMKNTHKHHEH